ncbi:hypothetical protein [Leeuwenhoekiella sp. H156]|uniref:hypothetical protein n=1 Tax=Leeuwenhoekiella sp. H156 TaxID=3450128 RepID=UPI003FA4059C
MEGTIQDQKIKLIQWLSTLEDAGTIEILMQLRDADKTDWWSTISEAERHSIEKGITDANANRLKSHAEVKAIYEKWL